MQPRFLHILSSVVATVVHQPVAVVVVVVDRVDVVVDGERGAAAGAGGEADAARVAESKTGYLGVSLVKPGQPKPYQTHVRRAGKNVYLGSFATAEEAALCIARTPEGQAAAEERAAALTSEEARQQARAEGLTLRVAESKTGYFGVKHHPGRLNKPCQARVSRGGKQVSLGDFATAVAALYVARSPEGQA
eukprot:scaffold137798_cov69-Phaeocystis_antarctica.AAC.1